ncbi:MAG TPA: haloacid dehalogenase [Cyanobacteria bacterium UBA11049]|nr:haloacid dehalogenase [Cyanobacteria bacterium UBA11049]
MSANTPTILALDFDGVVCDGLIEYFETAWRTYCEIWSPPHPMPPEDLAPRFCKLRPVIETGWEMPVLIRALQLGVDEADIWHNWAAIAQQLLQQADLTAADIGKKLDRVRDEWISTDLDGWLSLHRFYPGVVEKLQFLVTSSVQPVIITTKEGRFVSQLLQQQGVDLPEKFIFGKESKRPKYQIIQELIGVTAKTAVSLWFVEDRLKTLQLVQQQADLEAVRLFLADWGYNTASEREIAVRNPRIHLLSLSQFKQDFSAWA